MNFCVCQHFYYDGFAAVIKVHKMYMNLVKKAIAKIDGFSYNRKSKCFFEAFYI